MKLVASLCTLVLLAAGCTPAREPGQPHARYEAAGDVRAAEQRRRAGGRPGGVRGHQGQALPERRPQDRQGRHARHAGRFAVQESAAGAVQVPRLGGAAGGRHAWRWSTSARIARRSGAGRASRCGVLPIPPVAGTAPVLVYDTVGHGYKVDYQAVIGGGEPGTPCGRTACRCCGSRSRAARWTRSRTWPRPSTARRCSATQMQQAAKVFAPNDFFGVLPDGTAWVARGHENRVDWRASVGTWTRGKAHDYTKVPVTQADRDRVLAQVREQGKQFGMPQELEIRYPFAETKPPFDFALGRPNGEVWLQRPARAGGRGADLRRVQSQGGWQREVVFPAGASLAGFGAKGAVYGVDQGGGRAADGGAVHAQVALRLSPGSAARLRAGCSGPAGRCAGGPAGGLPRTSGG